MLRGLLAVFPFGLAISAARGEPEGVRFAPTPRPQGAVVAAAGAPLARGALRPTRPRTEAFVPGQLPFSHPPAALVRQPFRADPGSVRFPDRMDAVFLARSRPVRVQLVIRTSGKRLAERWDEHLRSMFAAFDRDGNGTLNRYELEHIFPTEGMRQMFQGGLYYRAGNGPPWLDELDRDGDYRISFAEFAAYYQESVSDLIKPRPMPGPADSQDPMTQELFARLDTNKDGKLSEQELRAAEKTLLALDGDEDECVSSQELLTNPVRAMSTQPAMVAPKAFTGRPGPNTSPPASQELGIYPNGIPQAIVQQLVKRYDQNGDSELTRSEIGFPDSSFARLDRDKNDRLTATELDGWRKEPPDVTVELELGDTPLACKTTARPHGGSWAKDISLRQTQPGRLVLRIGAQSMELAATTPPAETRQRQTQQLLAGIFPRGGSVVTETDLVGPQNQFLRVIFDAADFNGDGRLTRAEFERYFALQRRTSELGMILVYSVRTPNLFQSLDENLDGKLGVRELRTAWDRMIVLEPAGATAVSRAILQPNAALRLAPAPFAFFDSTSYGAGSPESAQGPPRGPLWFRKMDRNGDGDLSRAEFLAAEEYFQALDTDKDGLISLAEAEAYEKRARRK